MRPDAYYDMLLDDGWVMFETSVGCMITIGQFYGRAG